MESTVIRFPWSEEEQASDPARADFARSVRDALRHLHDLVYLQTHPLAGLLTEPNTTPLITGKRLQQRLVDAIAALRPDSNSGDARASRRYELLMLRYNEALEIADVAARLTISRREYDREHRQALDAVISLLRDGRALSASPLSDPPSPDASDHASLTGVIPLSLTSFIGRDGEMQQIVQLIQSARLVTLTGPPGTGKTRLALEVGRELAASSKTDDIAFPDGLAFVPLASIHDPALVVLAIAHGLGVREVSSRSLIESLVDHLCHRRTLLILDNFEHLLDAAPAVSQLLTVCSHLNVLVTSRISLRLSGEHEFLVPPLRVPDDGGGVRWEQVARSDAVRLYVERARAINSSFCLTGQNAPAIVDICRRLDGLPLAIELAAARVRVFTPQGMLQRLQRRLPLLTGGAQDLPARQRTMQAAITWSHDLLTQDEQLLYRQLAVFAGGFTLDAAQAVCDRDCVETDLIDGVTSLVDKNLVRQEEVAGESRFSMLQVIREYGLERLAESGEAAELYRRHALYFADRAESVERGTVCSGFASVYRRAVAERDNFRAALDWSQGVPGDSEVGLRLVAGLSSLWALGEYAAEGRALAEAVLARPDAAQHPELRAGALITAGALEQLRNNHEAAFARLLESLQILRGTRDGVRLSQALVWLGMTAMGQGDDQSALRWFSECRDVSRTETLSWQEATALSLVAEILVARGDLDEVRAVAEEASGRYRALHDAWGSARMQRLLAGIAWMEGDYATADRLCTESLRVLRAVGERWNLARALTRMGILLLDEDRYEEAEGILTESLVTWRDMGNDAGITLSLAGLTAVVAARGQTERARCLYTAEPLHRPSGGVPLDSLSSREFDHLMRRIRERLGDHPSGDAPIISLEAAVDCAREGLPTGPTR